MLKKSLVLNIYFCLYFNLIKIINMNINIMNTQIFHKIKYDLKGHKRSHKNLLAKFFQTHSFINRF